MPVRLISTADIPAREYKGKVSSPLTLAMLREINEVKKDVPDLTPGQAIEVSLPTLGKYDPKKAQQRLAWHCRKIVASAKKPFEVISRFHNGKRFVVVSYPAQDEANTPRSRKRAA